MMKIRTALYATSMLLCANGVFAQQRQTDIDAVIATEKAFAKLALDSAAQAAYDRYVAPDATLFRPRAERAANWQKMHPLSPDLALTWQPDFVDVSRRGDFAYVLAPWGSASRSVQNDPHFGQQLNIWRKQRDGRWLVAVNVSVPGPSDAKVSTHATWPAAAPAYVPSGKPLNDRVSLLSADNAFASSVKTLDYAAAMKKTALPDARLIRAKQYPTIGIDAIVKETTGARVTMWLPVESSVSAGGDMGYTRGSYVVSLPRGTREAGDYVRIWRRDRNGTWRIALDMLTSSR
jgi:ketosteroid isomerase-like protein